MVSKILKYYKTNFGLWNVFFRHLKWGQFLLYIFPLIIAISSIIYLSFRLNLDWLSIVGLLLMFAILPFFKKESNRIVKEVHQFENKEQFFSNRKNKFKTFLKDKGIDDKEKVNYLISLVNENIEESKTPFLVNRGLIAAIIVPIWVQFLGYIYKNEITSFEGALFVMVIFVILIIMVWVMISVLKMIFYDEIINSNYNRLRNIEKMLKDLYLTL
jgi:hypothetical protein